VDSSFYPGFNHKIATVKFYSPLFTWTQTRKNKSNVFFHSFAAFLCYLYSWVMTMSCWVMMRGLNLCIPATPAPMTTVNLVIIPKCPMFYLLHKTKSLWYLDKIWKKQALYQPVNNKDQLYSDQSTWKSNEHFCTSHGPDNVSFLINLIFSIQIMIKLCHDYGSCLLMVRFTMMVSVICFDIFVNRRY
jgi:hypothetical protein